jgi:hypothetical protein
LQGEEVNEIRVELKEVMADGAGDDYKDEWIEQTILSYYYIFIFLP